MDKLEYKQKIIDFITRNGWKEDSDPNGDFRSFHKDRNISIDIDDDEIVLVGDSGDFCHIMIHDHHSVYTLFGYLTYYNYLVDVKGRP